MADPIDIAKRASEPRKSNIDGVSIEGHSLADQIAADEYLRNQRLARKGRVPIRRFTIRPKGANG